MDANSPSLHALQTSDWFVVGPTVVLRAQGAALPLTFSVAVQGGPSAALTLIATPDGAIQATTDVPHGHRIEALRLATRLSWMLAPGTSGVRILLDPRPLSPADTATLGADGFAPAGPDAWFRPAAAFLRPADDRAADMEELYVDPFTIPWNFVGREHDVLDRAIAVLGDRIAGARVLDLGSGYGKNATFLEDRGCLVSGIELSRSAVDRCRELVLRPEAFVTGSAAALPWADGSFDLVLDIGCLHCMPAAERAPAVSEARRVLAPGGAVLSRLFRPRPPAWVRMLPYAATGFGVEPEAVRDLFGAVFDDLDVEETEELVYVTGRAA